MKKQIILEETELFNQDEKVSSDVIKAIEDLAKQQKKDKKVLDIIKTINIIETIKPDVFLDDGIQFEIIDE